jgi:hypothetical protein
MEMVESRERGGGVVDEEKEEESRTKESKAKVVSER